MFIASARTWYAGTEQRASGAYLLLFDHDTKEPCPVCPHKHRPVRGIVRHVRMHQFGHFMMGSMTIGPYVNTLSGSYGSDGLSRGFPGDPLWNHCVPFPPALVHRFWTDNDGHNSSGSEGPDVRAWALANLKALRKPWPNSSTRKESSR